MDDPLQNVSLTALALGFLPAVVVLVIFTVWKLDVRTAVHAMARMLIQLLIIGYLLTYIFAAENSLMVGTVLLVMLVAASWIAMRPLKKKGNRHYLSALTAIAVGGLTTLFFVTGLVLDIDPWFEPRYVVPIAGMIFASAMNAVSLAGERLGAEIVAGQSILEARRAALHTALIPTVNSLFAVGLVSLPGMMTGQILSGVSPLVAVRYQVVVMAMLFGASGISAAIYLIRAPTEVPAE